MKMNQTIQLLATFGSMGLTVLALAACSEQERSPAPVQRSLAEEWKILARTTVFFGHQSVGDDIVAGLRDLLAQERVPLRIVQADNALGLDPGTWGHGHIAYNGAPDVKLESFRETFEGDPSDLPGILPATAGAKDPDIAWMKFCYVDFHQRTDVHALFAAYRATMEAIRAKHPDTTLIHVTVPLTAAEPLPKALAKRLMRKPSSETMNGVRERFNDLLRTTYRGKEPIFDLAAIESTAPDGRRLLAQVGARKIPMLIPSYTHDGEHLNETGRVVVARELVTLLATVAQERELATRAKERASDARREASQP
jgi:hypothetical protein